MPIVTVLCYIEGCWAYFTSRRLADQWGDDWNDAPYEHNAGRPYPPRPDEYVKGEAPWIIHKVAFEVGLETPADMAGRNSGYSVEQINARKVAWLSTPSWNDDQDSVDVWAGTRYRDFVKIVESLGGTVYEAREEDKRDE